MVNTQKNIKDSSKPITDSGQLKSITNYDLRPVSIESLIRVIRDKQVILDSDLATLYNVETRTLNQSVKRNLERFPEDFVFQLTKEETDNLKSQSVTSSWGGTRKCPYAFTESGIAMLSGILRSQTAIEVNIRIMRAFVTMRHFLANNAQVFQRLTNLEYHQIETDEKIDLILNKMEEQSPKLLPEQIFQTGCVWDAWAYLSDLVRSAKLRIVLIDNFVDDRVLTMLSKRAVGVSATIHTRYNEQFLTDLRKHNEQYPEIIFVQLPHRNHDRFLIIDDKAYLLGASVKDIGAGLCAVTELSTSPETILKMLE